MIIKISNKSCLIDDEDLALISDYNWYIHARTGYARGRIKGKPNKNYNFISMHRLIMGILDDKSMEDRDHNKLNNQKQNLRICTHKNNLKNRTGYGKSKYLGVCSFRSKWKADIGINGKPKYIGVFENEEDAAKAYDEKAKIIHGEFANLNFK